LAIAAASKSFSVSKARKAYGLRAFLFGAALVAIKPVVATECPPLPTHETVAVSQVIDGDTLRLADGQRLRLLAVNTPELAHDGIPEQALARTAQQAVKEFFEGSGTDIAISFGERRQDRYGRLLAHVSHPRKGSLEAFLVSQGLAFPISVPPDMGQAPCLLELAEEARHQGLGIWADDYWQPVDVAHLNNVKPAFRRVCGKITNVDEASGLWLETQGDLVFRIGEQDLIYFNDSKFDATATKTWQGQSLEAWGWLRDRRDQTDLIARGFKPWVLQVRSPYVMRWVEHCN